MTRLTRRRVLATGVTLSTGSLAGCFGSGGSDDSEDTSGEEELITPDKATITETGEGISARVRSVRHNPDDQVVTIEGAVSVPTEAEYRIRLAVVDKEGVALAQEVLEKTLYTGTEQLVTTELNPEDCEACFSGAIFVDLSEAEQRKRADERERKQEEQRERQEEQAQQQNETNATEESQ